MKNILTGLLFLGTVFASSVVVAGDLQGPRLTTGTLHAHGVDKYYFTVAGGRKAEFWVRGSKSWNLSVQAEDVDGNVIVADNCTHDSCHLVFNPALNSPVIIKVMNNVGTETHYRLATN